MKFTDNYREFMVRKRWAFNIRKWVHDFSNGREEVHDFAQVERPSTTDQAMRLTAFVLFSKTIVGTLFDSWHTKWVLNCVMTLHTSQYITGGMQFQSNEEVGSWCCSFFWKLDPKFYVCGISKLLSQYDKCLNINGNYVEKS